MPSLTKTSESSSGLSLAIRLQARDSQAWGELVELYGPLVDHWAARAGLKAATREDVAQEVFLVVHQTIDRFDPTIPQATFRGWLWTIARNVVLKVLSRSGPPPRGGSTAVGMLADVIDPWPDGSDFDPPSDAGEITSLLNRALAQIRPRVEQHTWEAFWLTVVESRPTCDVAAQLGMTSVAVRKARSRTLHRLRRQLGDDAPIHRDTGAADDSSD